MVRFCRQDDLRGANEGIPECRIPCRLSPVQLSWTVLHAGRRDGSGACGWAGTREGAAAMVNAVLPSCCLGGRWSCLLHTQTPGSAVDVHGVKTPWCCLRGGGGGRRAGFVELDVLGCGFGFFLVVRPCLRPANVKGLLNPS